MAASLRGTLYCTHAAHSAHRTFEGALGDKVDRVTSLVSAFRQAPGKRENSNNTSYIWKTGVISRSLCVHLYTSLRHQDGYRRWSEKLVLLQEQAPLNCPLAPTNAVMRSNARSTGQRVVDLWRSQWNDETTPANIVGNWIRVSHSSSRSAPVPAPQTPVNYYVQLHITQVTLSIRHCIVVSHDRGPKSFESRLMSCRALLDPTFGNV